MNVLLIFFAIPVAIIILSIILEKYLNCPLSVAGIFFSILLVVVFYLGITATHEKRTQFRTGLYSKYMMDKWEYTVKEKGGGQWMENY